MTTGSTGTVLKTDGTPLTDRDARRGMRLNIVAGTGGTVWGVIAVGMPFTMFMNAIGASGTMIGAILTIQQLSMILQIPSAWLSERLETRKRFWGWVALPHRLVWMVPAILPLYLAPSDPRLVVLVFVAVAASSVLGQMGTAAWWSWMADLVPPAARSRFWGLRHSILSVSGLIGTVVAGVVLDSFPDPRHPGGSFMGFVIVLMAAAILGALDILLHLGVPEPKPRDRAAISGFLASVVAPLRNRDFRWLTLSMAVWTFGAGLVNQFGAIYLNRVLGIGYSGLSITILGAMIGASLAGFLWGYVMDRVGARNFGAIMMLAAPLCGIGWFFLRAGTVTIDLPFLPSFQVSQPVLVLTIAGFVAGLLYSGVGLAQVSLAAALLPPTGRTMAMAVHWSLVGAFGAVGPLVAGRLMDLMDAHPVHWVMPTGTPLGFFHILILAQIAIVSLVGVRWLLRIERRQGEMAFRTALASLQFTNPLRMFSGAFNIFSMLSSESVESRADAARKIGEDRVRIAVRDLIERLDDASYDVRHEAAIALGRIGSPDAVDALLRKLEDPDGDLGPVIARALRYARNQASVEALIRQLGDKDRETVSEAARTLGDIGDARAARALMEVLRKSDDAKIISASGVALAQLGEMAAIYDILPIMQATANPVMRRSLAVAVADLLGRPGEFYKFLSRDQRDRGTAADAMIEDLRKSVAAATRDTLEQQGRMLMERLDLVSEAYAQRDLPRVSQLLFECAIGLAALRYGIDLGGDEEVFLENVVWRDPKFGVGVWYLELFRESSLRGAAAADDTGALLGIYVLSLWSAARDE